MKQRFIIILAGFLFLTTWTHAQSIETKFQSVIDSIRIANPSSLGIMLHVEAPEKGISWSGTSGYSEKNTQEELEPDQPGLIASNIKTFVSASILKLVEEKKLSTEQSIKNLLTVKTRVLFETGGYNLDSIKIKHLLSHTSGIENYANQAYIDFIDTNKNYRWTRDEQLELTISTGPPLGKPESVFRYTDANYLLLTEIIENITGEPFYTAMRNLLGYGKLGLYNTWIPTLEEIPNGTKNLVHQYWDEYGWDSYEMDVSFDLYGGGGIACTSHDLATFIYKLFNGEVIKDTAVFNLIFTEVPTQDTILSNYYFGISSTEYQGLKAFGHGGFWGTRVVYFPELKAAIAVFVLVRDFRSIRNDIINRIIELINE